MRTSSRNVAVLLFDEIELLDVAAPVQVLTLAGRQWNWRPFKLFAVAAEPRRIATRNQLGLEAAFGFADCPPPELVIVPGGYGARRAAESQEITGWLRSAAATADVLIATGFGALLLGRAGLLDGVDVAAPREVAELLAEIAPGARPETGRRWAESGKIVTARGGAATLDATLFVLSRLLGEKQASAVAEQLGHDWTKPTRIDIVPKDG